MPPRTREIQRPRRPSRSAGRLRCGEWCPCASAQPGAARMLASSVSPRKSFYKALWVRHLRETDHVRASRREFSTDHKFVKFFAEGRTARIKGAPPIAQTALSVAARWLPDEGARTAPVCYRGECGSRSGSAIQTPSSRCWSPARRAAAAKYCSRRACPSAPSGATLLSSVDPSGARSS